MVRPAAQSAGTPAPEGTGSARDGVEGVPVGDGDGDDDDDDDGDDDRVPDGARCPAVVDEEDDAGA